MRLASPERCISLLMHNEWTSDDERGVEKSDNERTPAKEIHAVPTTNSYGGACVLRLNSVLVVFA